MYQTIMQYVFITTIAIMVIGLVAPAFASSTGKTNTLLGKFVIPISNSSEASQAFTVAHLEKLLQQDNVLAANLVLIAYDKGIYLLEKGNHFQSRVQALADKGVQFYACEKTQVAITRLIDNQLDLIDSAKNIADGKQYIETLMEQGFVNSFA
jgi:intracellular sulfur oxidation DsrE/DsrF family protein